MENPSYAILKNEELVKELTNVGRVTFNAAFISLLPFAFFAGYAICNNSMGGLIGAIITSVHASTLAIANIYLNSKIEHLEETNRDLKASMPR